MRGFMPFAISASNPTKPDGLGESEVAYSRYGNACSSSRPSRDHQIADQFHVPAAVQAIAAGKHVLVEKPLGVSVEECAHI